ncbi:uncharacterized protein LOC129922938 [Biomphalaria glabrata]|uniref:Uncharacterized protein LOC129922938 n=1 Tax=Biomphalaria glabrata TaxID=6526 RepID=A0A9W2YWV1_BIOGL|nr:uncharacterized protein LOC129922938 [Biomphalaria glabrata]
MARFIVILRVIFVTTLFIRFTENCDGSATIFEGKSYTLQAKFINKFTEKEYVRVLWLVNEETVSQCSITEDCLDNFEELTKTTLSFNEDTGFVTCDVTIIHVTKNHFGTWKLKYLGIAGLMYPESLFTCTLLEDNTLNSVDRQSEEHSFQSNTNDVEVSAFSIHNDLPKYLKIFVSIFCLCVFVTVVILLIRKMIMVYTTQERSTKRNTF